MNKYKELIAVIQPDGFVLDWHETQQKPQSEYTTLQQELYKSFEEHPYRWLLEMGFTNKLSGMSPSLQFMGVVAGTFVEELSQNADVEILREKTTVYVQPEQSQQIIKSAPFMTGSGYLTRQWIETVWASLNRAFSEEIKDYKGSTTTYFASKSPRLHPAGRVFFHLVESKKEGYSFAFLATYSSETTSDGKCRHLPLKNALVEYRDDNRKLLKLLSTVHKAAEKSNFISELLATGEIFHPIGLDSEEAYTFLNEVVLYEESGILCRIPNWWRRKTNTPKISISVGENAPSRVGYDSLVGFKAELSLGGETITEEEIKKLISQSEGLTLIKGKWVEVNRDKLEQTLRAYEKAQSITGQTGMTMIEAMRLQLGADRMLDIESEECEIEITNGKWLSEMLGSLKKPEKMKSIKCGGGFSAVLRDYQKKGLNWLYYMKTLGFGACLADDMGLGKTIQIIALLDNMKSTGQKSLLIVPASLIGNWTGEIDRFAPFLKYYILHPSENSLNEGSGELPEGYSVFITTYGMTIRYEWLKDIKWNMVVLDEAQAIKNPGTKQTRAVKRLPADFRVAMTGTPVENRLSDLWSLFDFLNKGLLGTSGEFSKFTKKLGEHHEGYGCLKKVVQPFILRRLKTDKTVIKDLPEKIEMKTYATLTKKQYALYDTLVKELKEKLDLSGKDTIGRKGLVLSSIMKFKQICNHPDQYLGQDIYEEKESGKFGRLREICETIYEKRERVLVFTQFKSITEHLKNYLEKVFQHEGLVLHGETPVAKRKRIVSGFQGSKYIPFLVLSIKAGGVGLNLTNANHVIHFDRWWNPAVENQATDRAFRIGQSKNVIVHKFITKGTIEEKIDLMIEDKVELQNKLISGTGENMITEMDNRELMELFSLRI